MQDTICIKQTINERFRNGIMFYFTKRKENGAHHEWFWWESRIIKKKSRKKPCESFEGMGPKENLKSVRQTFIKS